MKTYLLTGPKKLELAERPIPKLKEREVLIKVMASGVCNMTDLYYYDNYGLPQPESYGKVQTQPPTPFAGFGHEIAGVVEEVGPNAVRVEEFGKTVIPIRKGDRVFCRHRTDPYSGFSEYCTARDDQLGYLAAELTWDHGVIGQTLAVCFSGGEAVQLGDHAVIFGQGPVGLIMTQLALLRGVSRLVVVDGNPTRLALASRFGAHHTLNYRDMDPNDLVDAILDCFHGREPDIVFECAGNPTSVQHCFDLVRERGTVTILGTQHQRKRLEFDLIQWETKAPRIIMTREVRPAMLRDLMIRVERVLAGNRFDSESLVSHRFLFEDLPKAIQQLKDPNLRRETLKAVIDIGT